MSDKKYIIRNISNNQIDFDNLFDERNIYNMTKDEFFSPSVDDEHDAMSMHDMPKSVDKILSVMSENKKICIYGDYDVDGTSATAILLKTFDIMGYKNVTYYIPHRKKEGYGLNNEAIEKIRQGDVSIIITVDCGITAVEEVQFANSLDMEVIVTDHHQVPDILPPAFAIVNPHKKNCKYPYKNLCGAGIAYKLSRCLLKQKNMSPSAEILEIAGIATIADIMEINGENRIIVKNAIQSIKDRCENLGVRALLSESKLNQQQVDEDSIGFAIAPRINSAGRIDSALLAVRLYMSKNEIEAKTYAAKLNQLNYQRQEMVKSIYESSLKQSESQMDDNVIVSYDEGWDVGVIGIVASRLVDDFSKPAIVIAIEDGIGHASCRSIGNFNIFNALSSMSDLLEKFGGHDMAAGFSIKKSNIKKLIKSMNRYAKKYLQTDDFILPTEVDYLIEPQMIELENYEKMQSFEPFGISNIRPTFMVSNVRLENPQFIGKDKTHFKARSKTSKKDMLKFHAYDKYKDLDFSKKFDIIFRMNKNVFNDNVSIQMMIQELYYSYDYYQDSSQIYNIVKDNFSYLEMGYKFGLKDYDFEVLPIEEMTTLDGNTAYLCYTYDSYFYLKNLFQDEQLKFYQDNSQNYSKNTIILFPLLDKTELEYFENIVLCDNIKKIEKSIFTSDAKKYCTDFKKFNVKFKGYNIRETMVIIYNFYKKYQNSELKISDVVDFLNIDLLLFFIINSLLVKLNLIDISYDFQYNKIYTKINLNTSKQNLSENIIYQKLEEYFALLN